MSDLTGDLKVGVISCSGEELPEGTVSRLATRMVLEKLRPGRTVTLCLPLFLAGGKGERAFARVHPTIAVDGCDKRCAARATAAYSAEPAASVVVTEVAGAWPAVDLGTRRRLGSGGEALARRVGEEIAAQVDRLFGPPSAAEEEPGSTAAEGCACQSLGVPIGTLRICGEPVSVVALQPILDLVRRASGPGVNDEWRKRELLRQVAIYNPVPTEQEAAYAAALWEEYQGREPGR